MRTVLAAMIFCGAVGLAAAGSDDKRLFYYVDLQPKANQKLDEPLHSGSEGNDLAQLPRGEQTLAKVKFKIGASLIQLGSTLLKDVPAKVDGIAVDRTLARLHFLHACGYGGAPEGQPTHVKDGTPIGSYVVHYDDKTMATIPIVYGQDVRDWWDWDNSKETPRSRLAWRGDNEYVKKSNIPLLLYRTSWDNPHPDKRVVSLDYVSSNDTVAAPFCVAVTAERK
jgi:hypothetical protein